MASNTVVNVVCYGSPEWWARCANFAVANHTIVAATTVTQQEIFYTTVTAKTVAVKAVAQHHFLREALPIGGIIICLVVLIALIALVVQDIYWDDQEDERVALKSVKRRRW
jgi:hypothetical protein